LGVLAWGLGCYDQQIRDVARHGFGGGLSPAKNPGYVPKNPENPKNPGYVPGYALCGLGVTRAYLEGSGLG